MNQADISLFYTFAVVGNAFNRRHPIQPSVSISNPGWVGCEGEKGGNLEMGDASRFSSQTAFDCCSWAGILNSAVKLSPIN